MIYYRLWHFLRHMDDLHPRTHVPQRWKVHFHIDNTTHAIDEPTLQQGWTFWLKRCEQIHI
jgi:hypothetical protein